MLKKKLCITILTLIIFVICTASQAQAQKNKYTSGFKTISIWKPDGNIRINVNIWYPALKKPSLVTYGSWKIRVAKNAKKAEGTFPLILLSHDSAGGRFSYHNLAAFLAKNGFIVVAPTHYGDNMNNMNAIYTIYQITGRILHLNTSLNTVLNDELFKDSIDKNKIGVLGFGVGGTAALILGGASPKPERWASYCDSAQINDPYCTTWAKSRITKLVSELSKSKNLANSLIKAVAIITPSYGMLFNTNSAKKFTSPLLIVKAEEDTINPAPFHADALKNIFYNETIFATLKEADSFALMSDCPPDILKDLEEMCTTVDSEKRQLIHDQLYPLIEQFFSKSFSDITK